MWQSSHDANTRSGLFNDLYDRFAVKPLFENVPVISSLPPGSSGMGESSSTMSSSYVVPAPPKRPLAVERLLSGSASIPHQQQGDYDLRPSSSLPRARSSSARSSRPAAVRHRVRADNWMPMTLLETTRELFEQLERKEKLQQDMFAGAPAAGGYPAHAAAWITEDQLRQRGVADSRAASAPSTVNTQKPPINTNLQMIQPEEIQSQPTPAQVTPKKQYYPHTARNDPFEDDAFFFVNTKKQTSAPPPVVARPPDINDPVVDIDELNRLLDERTPSETSHVPHRATKYKLENVDAEQKKEVLRGFADFCSKKKKMPKSNMMLH